MNPQQAGMNITTPQPVLQAPDTGTGDQRFGGTTALTTLVAGTGAVAPPKPAPVLPAGPTAQELADFNAQKGVTMGSINDSINSAGGQYHQSILDYLDSRKAAQKTINAESTQNELARQQGHQGILDMIGNGIKSGGVTLANANAGSSSAGEALARAYSVLGRQQESSIGNQFAQGNAKIGAEQENLNAGDETQIRHSKDKTGTINSIVNGATTALTALNQAAATANISDRVQIDAKIAAIKQQALAALSAYDAELTGGIAGQAPQGSDTTRAEASRLLTAGVAPESSFNFTSNVPTQFQGTGDFASSLPIFTNKRQAALA